MKITPTTLTISQLFGSTHEQFLIPAYQRRYSWGEKQFKDLFDDIDLLNSEDTHLFGTILCLTSNYIAGINTLELVDGQQRITTLTILLKVLRDKFMELGEEELYKELEGFLYCKGIDRKLKNKIVLGDLDNPDFTKLIDNTDLHLIKNKNLLNAYNYFKKRIDQYTLEQLLEFYYKLVNKALIIRLDVANAKDAYKLFETINNRGLRLSPTDIIKNFLLGHASLLRDDVLYQVRENWKELIINLDGIDPDNYFRQYLSGVLARKVTESNIIDEFKKYYCKVVKEAELLSEYIQYQTSNQDINNGNNDQENEDSTNHQDSNDETKQSIVEFSRALRDASMIYAKIINRTFSNKTINKHLFNLQRIKSFPSYIFLLNLFQRSVSEKDIVDILKLIEIFMLRRHICEYRTGELDSIFSNLVLVSDHNIVNEVKEKLAKHIPDDQEFKSKFVKHNFKGNENRAKYILEEIEYYKIQDMGEYVLNSGNDLHLEHIIPQKINTKKSKEEYGDWEEYLGEDSVQKHKDFVNRIGNLTLIAKSLNIVASNNPFENKLEEYKKSNIKITREIAENFTQFKFEQVHERSEQLAEIAVKIWSFN
jgi:uncharacterized protein with ParB-like and HNH nuclease domain